MLQTLPSLCIPFPCYLFVGSLYSSLTLLFPHVSFPILSSYLDSLFHAHKHFQLI